ncbi:DNA-binding protein [Prevotella sp. HMSC077E09]|uniref:helix-turn-helix domain-containing protein n=1 Tax=Prevotella sp. HMSC077E09 TaxID=1739487 RepID=UPI0008A49FD0|nr:MULTISPECIES: helix-turn-helix domain-containing protein [unclassified Prevotella]OFO73647.1 DNA-binding protein [Prevotella sp. HMSC077E08]OFP61347.1 DNA-binding protein [Prevotella sp. HMSC077E09]
MEVITIKKKTYEAMMERFRILTSKVDALCWECDEKRMGRWLDNQDVCQILNISLRTLQTYRSNRMLPYTQIGYKMFYKPEDVGKLLEQSSSL